MRKRVSGFLSSPPFLVFMGVFVFITMLFGNPFRSEERSKDLRWRERMTNLRTYFSWALKPADTVFYKQGARTWDSIQRIFQNQDKLNNFKEDYTGSQKFMPFLVYETEECIQCDEPGNSDYPTYQEADKAAYHFIGLKGFRIKDHRYYFRDNNTNFIIPFQRAQAPSNDTALKYFRFYDRLAEMKMENMYSVPFRYDYWNGAMLIPVSKKTYSVFRVINGVIMLLVIIYSWILVFMIPYRIIGNIALGQAFHIKTIKLVDFLAYNFLLYPFVVFIYRCIAHLVASKYITSDLRSTALTELMRSGPIMYIGLLLFALGVALKKGYKLQQEQDLTI